MYSTSQLSRKRREQCGRPGRSCRKQSQSSTTRPRTDIRESESGFLLLVDVPGLDESQVDVTVEQNVLTVRGSANNDVPEGFEHVHKESEARQYERVFRLSKEIDTASLTATVKNGVLTINIPKSKEAQPVRVPVQAG